MFGRGIAWWTAIIFVGVLWAARGSVVVTVAGTMIEGLFESTGSPGRRWMR
ncbi:MAG: hypothetical protein R3B46_10420 [Phycisphaerales bacterium]